MVKLLRSKFAKVFVILLCVVFILAGLLIPYYYHLRLFTAIENEDYEKVEKLLIDGYDPNKTDIKPSVIWDFLETYPRQPLAEACSTGNLEIVKLLIEHGATAEYRDGCGWSPLRKTLFYFHPDDIEMVKLLLENGASLDDLESDCLPVFAAAQMTPKVFDKTKANGTVFSSGYDEETAKGITEIVIMLLGDKSVDITTSTNGQSLLMLAVQKDNVYLAQYLISAGCDVDYIEKNGKTALDFAVENGNEEMIMLLKQSNTENAVDD